MLPFQVEAFRAQFPLLSKTVNSSHNALCYLDNAATTQKMSATIDTINTYYQAHNANVHRGSYQLSANTTASFEAARLQVQTLLNAQSEKEIIWTKGTTESINLVANSWGRANLQLGDEIIVSYAEHHANIVPWQMIAEQVGAVIRVIPLLADGTIDMIAYDELLSAKTKLVCCHHISNVIGKINPIEQIITKAKLLGITTLIDGAQAISHVPVDVQTLECDFYVFSSHKMYGPTGLGVLYGKLDVLNAMPPYQGGGEMIKHVSFSGTTYNELPFKFEAGTPNISAVLGFQKAIEQWLQWNNAALKVYEDELTAYTYQQLSGVPSLQWLVDKKPDVGIFSFTLKGFHHQDVASFLDSHHIAVRSGHHCAMPLMTYLKVDGCIRVSTSAYNTKAEIDRLISVLTLFIKQSGQYNEELTDANTLKDISSRENIQASSIAQQSAEAMTLVINDFTLAKSWDAKHRLIMLIAKELERLPKELRVEESLIEGCESKAWLIVKQDQYARYSFTGDSDARVIRGLMYITLLAYQGLTKDEVVAVDIKTYFEQLGLLQHLSPSRGNGLLAIVERIKQLVCKH